MGPEVAFTTRVCTCNLMDWNTLRKTQGSYNWILKKSLSNFPDLKFFFQSYNNKCLISENFFVLVKSYSISPVCLQPIMKKALFLSFLKSLLTTDLSDNLESGKRNYCLGKRSGKSIEFIFWCMCKGVFTWDRGEFRPGASSLRFPFMARYLFTWYHHKMSCPRESPRREFTPVLVPGREFHSGAKSRNGIM